MKDFRDLLVWQKGHQLTLNVYRATGSFPREELYGLTSQMRRASKSIPGNIAEGCGKGSDADLGRYLQIALGSASELEYYFILARDLEYMNHPAAERFIAEVTEVKRMLTGFIQKLKADR